MKKNTLVKLLLVALLVVVVVWVGMKDKGESKSTARSSEESVKVGILQTSDNESLDLGREGFLDGLEDLGYVEDENLEVVYLNAQGDQSNLTLMSDQLVSEDVDLILSLGTQASQAVVNATTEIPILFTCVAAPVEAKIVTDLENPNSNVSGTSAMPPVEEQLKFIQKMVPDVETVGAFYTASEANAVVQVGVAQELAPELGLNLELMTVASTNDVQQNAEVLMKKVDAVWIPADNIIATTMPTVKELSLQYGIPVVTGFETSAKVGGIGTVGVDYYKLGYQTSDMADRLFGGEDIKTMPVEQQKEYAPYVNTEMTDALGLEVPEEYLTEE